MAAVAETILHRTMWCSGGGNRVRPSVEMVSSTAGRTAWTTYGALQLTKAVEPRDGEVRTGPWMWTALVIERKYARKILATEMQ